MLRKFFILLLLQVGIYNMYAQSVQRLETNPSFKGISIGMPIHSIADKLTYERSVNGFTLYKITSANYCSVFNVRMDFVRVVAKDGKVHAIDAVRMVKATESSPTVFNADDLDVIKQVLFLNMVNRLMVYEKIRINTIDSVINGKPIANKFVASWISMEHFRDTSFNIL